MTQLLPFFLILLAGFFLSTLFQRIHLPVILALIVAGIIVGPFGLELLEVDQTLDFLGRMGLIFLMFLAGLEVRLASMRRDTRSLITLASLNAGIPFLAGVVTLLLLGETLTSALFVGVIFMSSSVAIMTSTLAGLGLSGKRIGTLGIGGAVIQDIASLIILGVMLQLIAPTTSLPLWLFYSIAFLVILFVGSILPYIRAFFQKLGGKGLESTLFENDMRLIVTLLTGVVIVFESIGLHDIVAGFFTGLILSETLEEGTLKEKLHALGYGFFIPIFFIIIGLKTDIGVLFTGTTFIGFVALLMGVLIVSKIFSGWLGGRLAGMNHDEGITIGILSTSQLFTTLAVTITGQELGIISTTIGTAVIIISIVTTLCAPLIATWYAHRKLVK
jgi:Kef-type K+ transport system membrane component KefB